MDRDELHVRMGATFKRAISVHTPASPEFCEITGAGKNKAPVVLMREKTVSHGTFVPAHFNILHTVADWGRRDARFLCSLDLTLENSDTSSDDLALSGTEALWP